MGKAELRGVEVQGHPCGDPGEAAPIAGEDGGALAAPAVVLGEVAEEEGEAGGGGVAVIRDVHGHLLGREAAEAADLPHDEGVGLVQQQTVDLGRAEGEDLFRHLGDGEVEDVRAVHLKGPVVG